MAWGFEVDRTYNRVADIHGRFGGQQQGGIITPAAFPLVIAITGDEGAAHGYSDRLRPDGIFEYFGEGQVGDMSFKGGNKAIQQHSTAGEDLLLFRKTRAGLRFLGDFVCESYFTTQAPDTAGSLREAIVFELRPVAAIQEFVGKQEPAAPTTDLAKLREAALAASVAAPKKAAVTQSVFERARIVRDYVLARARGRCEDCGEQSPFTTPAGRPYLEAHHIRRMTDGGPDDPRFMIGLCPNCHRAAHFANDAADRNARMMGFVAMLENI